MKYNYLCDSHDLVFVYRYEILFKQKISTDDVFLGMSGKNSSTACCEDLVVCMRLIISEHVVNYCHIKHFTATDLSRQAMTIFVTCIHFIFKHLL